MSNSETSHTISLEQSREIVAQIKLMAGEFGFSHCSIGGIDLGEHEAHLQAWLDEGLHAELGYMASHGTKRSRPAELVEGTLSVISVRMDYLPADISTLDILADKQQAYISRYALGRDYHKLMRKRLTQFGKKIEALVGAFGYRAFVDSASVLERAIAQLSGSGWIGKNTMLINPQAGSWFFLGELFTYLPLPTDSSYDKNHCGKCDSCITACPTGAIIEPYKVDASKCISYLTIEYDGSIPVELRSKIGNRIFGCDDCQLFCPWNRFANASKEADFSPRHQLDQISLLELFSWDEATFLANTEGSPIRRTGFINWQRNISIALGNGPSNSTVLEALTTKRAQSNHELLNEHIDWAIEQLSKQ